MSKNLQNLRRASVLIRRQNPELFDKKVGIVMEEFKKGKLKSSSGHKVTSKDQALAIALSEARRAVLRHTARKRSKRG